MYATDVWIYDDVTETFEAKRNYDAWIHLNSCLLKDYQEFGGDIILVRQQVHEGQMFTYDWKIDVWTHLGSDWESPTGYFYHTALVQINER